MNISVKRLCIPFVPDITMFRRAARVSLLPLAAFLFLFLAPVPAEPAEADAPRESWMGVYLQDRKIGYLKTTIGKTEYDGKDAYRIESLMNSKLLVLGAEVKQELRTLVITDLQSSPLFQEFEMTSGGQTTKVEAVFTPEVIQCKVLSQGTSASKDVPIPPDVKLAVDSTLFGTGKKLQVGDKLSMNYFNPLRLSIDDLTVEVTAQEKIDVKGKDYDAFVVKNTTPMGDMISWQDENGEVIKILAIMGMTMLRETKEEAMGIETGAAYEPPKDFAVLTSVKTETEIKDPNRVVRLDAVITGMTSEKLVTSDSRQQAEWSVKDGVGHAQYTIKARKPDGLGSAMLPLNAEALKPYLAEAPYLQTNDPAIKKQAQQIIGKEKRSFFAASKIRKWVYDNMRLQADIGIVRSAVDVYNNRVGVCRDYAILYTALARAAGIPTRIVAGLVYANGGFYYHAWAESYTGQWTPFDPTLSTDFVDATHIKFVDGDATSMFELAGAMGGLKAQILSYEYLEK